MKQRSNTRVDIFDLCIPGCDQIRLLYERVPSHRKPNITHLDRPVIDSVPLIRHHQVTTPQYLQRFRNNVRKTYVISDLPRGKYIVCGEARDRSDVVFQADMIAMFDITLQGFSPCGKFVIELIHFKSLQIRSD